MHRGRQVGKGVRHSMISRTYPYVMHGEMRTETDAVQLSSDPKVQ